jgi:hypothetical protein
MSWIKTAAPSPENPELAEALEAARAGYPREYGPGNKDGRVPELVRSDSIVLSHSLIPGALKHSFAAFAAMMDPSLPLTRRQHEMIAATVSAVNRCFY